MAFMSIRNLRVAGVAACVPRRTEETKDFHLFSNEDAEKFIQTTGVERRHVVDNGTTASDLCFVAAEKLINDLGWDRNEIEVLIFVSHTPDYRLPSTSIILQKRLGLPTTSIAFDITLGCSGFLYGMGVVGNFLSTSSAKKALLLVGNTLSMLTSSDDKSVYPLLGDAGTATAIEFCEEEESEWGFHFVSDGSGAKSIYIPGGGFRNPINPDSFKVVEDEDGIKRNSLQYHMDGMEIFSYAVKNVPKSVNQLLENFDIDVNNIDYVLIHQANKFMCEKFRKKLNIPAEKVPYNIHNFGNTSGATIPLLMVTNLKRELESGKLDLVLTTIGHGFSISSAKINIGNVACPDLLTL